MASTYFDNPPLAHRVSDIVEEPQNMLMPITGYEEMPLVSIEEAIEPLIPFIPDVRRKARFAKRRCQNPTDDLSPDESASILLYTIEWEPYSDSLYFILNSILRTENRQRLKPWFLYLKLILTALSRLPSIPRTVYRGVKLNMNHLYPQGKIFTWWGFSSCTSTINILQEEQFLGKTGTRTLFAIECNSGKDIRRHSYIGNENEVLLLAGTQFQVTGCLDQDLGFHMITLKEVEALVVPLEPVSPHHSILVDSPMNLLSKISTFIMNRRNRTARNETYYNSSLEKRIVKFEPRSLVDLDRKALTDRDVPIVVQQAIINKQCTMLRLSDNRITSEGASILADALCNNITLEGLYLFNNCISDIGVQSLAQALSVNNSILKILTLGWNDITDEGVHHLAEMLKTNRILVQLWLPFNRIGDRGVQMLANVLIHHNSSLNELSLDFNNLMSDSSVGSLVDMLKHNRSLNALHVRNCNLSKASKARLQEVTNAKINFILRLY